MVVSIGLCPVTQDVTACTRVLHFSHCRFVVMAVKRKPKPPTTFNNIMGAGSAKLPVFLCCSTRAGIGCLGIRLYLPGKA